VLTPIILHRKSEEGSLPYSKILAESEDNSWSGLVRAGQKSIREEEENIYETSDVKIIESK
jgi:hypothetical protein